ncbi:FAD-dependent monooxygenase [Polaromonas glacialis]|uniref:FAD-dependent monooxygenase n=1 Tax=Polaromonas glacialis TaxID=866564 RepID=UPI000A00F7EC|nr:FAD-dependent monooxygenase [Polaromonas glacialis]
MKQTTDVAIIGGGPAGLMLAIELGCRGVDCVLLEEDIAAPDFPKANATSSRTMEHYRRRGFAQQIRSLGLAADHPQDVVYCTTLAGRELTRFSIPSRTEALNRTSFGDYGEESWPTPELPHRGQQMFIEPVLRAQAGQYDSVKLMLGWQAESMAMDDQQVSIVSRHAESGEALTLSARYVVGCDGPRSLVRKTCGIRYSGQSDEAREFFGGQMLSVYFTSSTLYQVLGKEKAWQYWAVNAVQRGLLIAIDGVDQFLFCLQLSAGQTPESVDFRAAMFAAIGREFAFELIAVGPWHAGFTLVADQFSKGRAFIAGDAAHLFTPTGGMGYNTSVDDAVNLGWKLAAVVKGWAGEELLDSYEAERKPIAQRNTTFARAMADSIGGIKVPPNVDAEGLDAERVRQQLGDALHRHVRNEFNIPGLQLGLRYEGSPIVASEAGAPTLDEPNHYLPSARPGARAPHIWLDGASIFDLFGRDYTLLCFTASDHNAPPADALAWQAAAAAMNVPLALVYCASLDARDLYGADRVLVRPDHHVAWRGDASADAHALLAMACARESLPALQPIAA